MKGRSLLKLTTILLPAIMILSCKKDDAAPPNETGGVLTVNSITINNFVPTDSTTLMGISKIQYLVPNTSSQLDTIKVTDTFTFATLTGFTKTYSLTIPANTSQMNFKMEVVIGKGGTASSVTANNIVFDYNGKNYLNSPITFQGTNNYFETPTQNVTF